MNTNNLVENLKRIQAHRHLSLLRFSEALNVPYTTLHSIMVTGNTTLYTVIGIADRLNMSLDSLVFGRERDLGDVTSQNLAYLLKKYDNLPPEKRIKAQFYFSSLVTILDSCSEGED